MNPAWRLYVVTFYPGTGYRRDKIVELNHKDVKKAVKRNNEVAQVHLITVAGGLFYRRGRRISWDQLRFTLLPDDNAPAN